MTQKLSNQKVKFDYWLLFSIAVGIIIYLLPTPTSLPPEGHKFLALLATLVLLFIKEVIPLPITMAAAGAMIVLLGIGGIDDVWPAFTDPVVFFVIGCLMLANIADQVGLTGRLGKVLLVNCGNNIVRYSFFACMMFGIASAFMHDVSAVTLGLVSLLPLMRAAEIKPGSNTGKFLVISMAFCCSVGGMGTLAGGGRNMVAVSFLEEFTGQTITFWEWMIHALPPAIIMIPIVWFTLYLLLRPDKNAVFPEYLVEEGMYRKPLSRDEKWTLMIVTIVFISFLTNSIHGIHYSVFTILAVFLLSALKIVDWDKLNNEVAWSVAILIFGGGIAIGRAMDYTGAARFLADVFFPFFQGRGWVLIFVAVGIFGSLFSEVMANVASAALLIPIAMPIAIHAGINPAIISLALGMFTSFAYLMVIGCPPNAIAYSFGYFSTTDLFKVGIVTEIVAMYFLTIVTLIWWNILGILI